MGIGHGKSKPRNNYHTHKILSSSSLLLHHVLRFRDDGDDEICKTLKLISINLWGIVVFVTKNVICSRHGLDFTQDLTKRQIGTSSSPI